MGDQVVLNGSPPAGIARHQNQNASLNLNGFHFTSVDNKFRRQREADGGSHGFGEAAVASSGITSRVVATDTTSLPQDLTDDPPLPATGSLTGFQGNFIGTGFNTIWRPRNKGSNEPPINGLSTTSAPGFPNDAVLELNLTKESLSFSGSLGNVPNRGFGLQTDIPLEANPYVQKISDISIPGTGGVNFNPTPAERKDIHFEPGMWVRIPSTTIPPQPATLSRMASIPHGTTINAVGPEPAATEAIAGPPPPISSPPNKASIPVASITPFFVGTTSLQKFPQQTLTTLGTSRIPANLTRFNTSGTITQDILTDPNNVLRNAIAGQTIIKTVTFNVSSSANSSTGGGISNITFLQGSGFTIQDNKFTSSGSNSHAASVSSQFWIETVQWTLTVPAGKSFPLDVQPTPPTQPLNKNPAPVPTFTISGPTSPLRQAKTITATSTQIQYSQNVLLNFGPLSWPHISVATLAQADKIPVTITA